jgi:type I restriction enzyme R subunit
LLPEPKENTDEAVALFSNKNAKEIIFDEPFDVYLDRFTEAVEKLYEITPTVNSVNIWYQNPTNLSL